MFDVPNPPNPHEVTAAISALIAMPKGERPFRAVVGNSFGADKINQLVAPIQQQTLKDIGLEHLTHLPETALV